MSKPRCIGHMGSLLPEQTQPAGLTVTFGSFPLRTRRRRYGPLGQARKPRTRRYRTRRYRTRRTPHGGTTLGLRGERYTRLAAGPV
ncbi:unnamed protein product [Merluccius merluccius]